MADEIRFSLSLQASKGGAAIATGTLSDSADMSGVDMGTVTQSIGTSNEALDIPADVSGDVTMVVKNLDATNYVEIFKDSGNSHLLSKLLPGEACFLNRVPSTTSLYGRSNTAAVQIQLWVTEA
jgi:hypothetical protein